MRDENGTLYCKYCGSSALNYIGVEDGDEENELCDHYECDDCGMVITDCIQFNDTFNAARDNAVNELTRLLTCDGIMPGVQTEIIRTIDAIKSLLPIPTALGDNQPENTL